MSLNDARPQSPTSPTRPQSPTKILARTKDKTILNSNINNSQDFYEKRKIRNLSSMEGEKRSFSTSFTNVLPKKLKKTIEEEIKYSNEVIKINSKGTPQSRSLAFSQNNLYCLDNSEIKRKVNLSEISRVSLSPHWDNVFCIHVENDFDFLFVSPDKTEIISTLEKIKKEKNPLFELEVCVTESFFFKALPNSDRQILFECPDGLRVGARVFVDIFDPSGNSISKLQKSKPKTLELDKEFSFSGDYDDSSDEETASTSNEDANTGKKRSGSTLLNKMMKVIPFKENTRSPSTLNFGKEEEENYVFFKWLTHTSNLVKGRKVDSWQIQGNRDYLEDAICVEYNLKMGADLLVGCFDGHSGSKTSDWLSANMKFMVEKNMKGKDLKSCLIASFEECHKNIINDKNNNSGSTALVAVFEGNKVTVANAGDCRALIIRHNGTQRLTKDHRLKDPEEYERVKKLGAKVKDDRVISSDGSQINLTRSIGDRRFQPYVIPKPDVIEYEIKPEDQFMVIACDGLWDTLSDDLTRTVTLNTRDPKRLCSLAYALGSRDNLTAMIIHLKEHEPIQTIN